MTIRTSHKLCLRSLIALVALASVACGSTATPVASTPVDTDPVNAAPHRVEVSFNLNPEVERTSEEEQVAAHEPEATITIADVSGTQYHSR